MECVEYVERVECVWSVCGGVWRCVECVCLCVEVCVECVWSVCKSEGEHRGMCKEVCVQTTDEPQLSQKDRPAFLSPRDEVH